MQTAFVEVGNLTDFMLEIKGKLVSITPYRSFTKEGEYETWTEVQTYIVVFNNPIQTENVQESRVYDVYNGATKINYIDFWASKIYIKSGGRGDIPNNELLLYRSYALLLLTKRNRVTMADVHDAWSVWALSFKPQSHNIIPFDLLPPQIKAMDQEFLDAIKSVWMDNYRKAVK